MNTTERVQTLVDQGLKLLRSGEVVRLVFTRDGGAVEISEEAFDAFAAKCDAEEPGRWPPAGVRRKLLVEARHLCAICLGGPPLQFHHMLEWAEIKHHDARHMLALCPTCHARCTNGFIDHKAQVDYKKRLTQALATATPGDLAVYRRIEDSEMRDGLTIGERVALRALRDEFGCEVRTDVRIAAGDGWINYHAAVVRGEDLIAIEIHEYKGGGFAYFQIEHLIQLATTLKIERFQRVVLYVVVISAVDQKLDDAVSARLHEIARNATCEVKIRMLRINPLRAKYSL
jgi:hypothetical protein